MYPFVYAFVVLIQVLCRQSFVEVGKGVFDCLDMIQFVHSHCIIDKVLLRKATIGDVGSDAKVLGISIKQIDEESEFLAHVIPSSDRPSSSASL